MRGLNKVMLIGNLGKDPEILFTENNVPLARISLATTEMYRDKTGKQLAQTEWHAVVLWRNLAEMAQQYLHKGSMIYLEGKLKTRTWDDKDGNKKSITEIVADHMVMLDKKVAGNAAEGTDAE
jgi:single-strand DNA-binding protein